MQFTVDVKNIIAELTKGVRRMGEVAMKCEIRRQEILNMLSQSAVLFSASTLSAEFGVSRQIIVKDIEKLREYEPAEMKLEK